MIWNEGVLYTGGKPIKGDRLYRKLRVWPPERSKLAALYYLGNVPEITKSDDFLYLGAGAGTTVSHLADYAGIIYAVEMAPEPLVRLLDVCAVKRNVLPVPADASFPAMYAPLVSMVDFLYLDIAQRNQVDICIQNLIFLKNGGYVIIMLKTRSIAVHEGSESICLRAVETLESAGLVKIAVTWLEKYHRGHAAIVCRKQ
jgi:fibrillarin-like pre-rRNA processing protein